ncbi:aminotransferase class IV [Marinitoga arctica]
MIYFNGKYFNEEIPYVINEGLMFGLGVFETLKVTNEYIEFFDLHYERLMYGVDTLDINFNISKEKLRETSQKLLKINKIKNGTLKINVLKKKDEFDVIITSNDRVYSDELKKRGYSVVFAENKKYSKNPLNYIKSNNYAINIIELEKALHLKKDEAIFLNENEEITEGAISNIFFVKNNELYTPKVECGLLNGIIRRIIVNEFDVKECIIKKDEIDKFDYAFLTNSLMRIIPIKYFEDVEYKFDYEYIKKIEYEILKIK